jgi:hypothetical protein
MTEVEFTSRRDAEEPLYLDSAGSRAPISRPAARVSDPGAAADRPLRLDLAREPRRKRRGFPLVLACALTFLLGAGAGVLFLQPPSVLRDTFATVLASAGTGDAKPATQAAPQAAPLAAPLAAPTGTEPPHAQVAASASQLQPAPTPESPPAPSAISDLPPASEPVAEPPAKPKAAARKPRPRRAAAPKKQPADAGSARAHSKAKAPLDLDALEKSLH